MRLGHPPALDERTLFTPFHCFSMVILTLCLARSSDWDRRPPGMVTRVSKIIPEMKVAYFRCVGQASAPCEVPEALSSHLLFAPHFPYF